jgi:ribosomal protein L7/L12
MQITLTKTDLAVALRTHFNLPMDAQIVIEDEELTGVTTFQSNLWKIISHPKNITAKIACIKLLRTVTGLGLKDSKMIVDSISDPTQYNSQEKRIFSADDFVNEVESKGGRWDENINLAHESNNFNISLRMIKVEIL